MLKDNHTKKYEFPPLSLLSEFVNDSQVVEESYVDQDGVCNFITNYFTSKGFVCNLLGVDYGFNITEYKLQLLSDKEKDDGFSYKNLFDKRRFYVEFIRKLYSFVPARTASIKIINDNNAPAEILIKVSVPNAFVRSVCLSRHLKCSENKFNYLFACDKYANAINYNCESGLTVICGSEKEKIFQTLRASIAGVTYKYTPNDLKIILYDLSDNLAVFNGIPHLQFAKNINSPNAFYELLQWVERDCENLSEKFNSLKCSSFDEYNSLCENKLARKMVVITNYTSLQNNYDAFFRFCTDKLQKLIENSKKYGYSYLIATGLGRNYPFFALEKSITNKIVFRTETEALSMLSINNADAHWLMSSNDALDCYKGERIIPCYITDFELHSTVDYLKQNNFVNTNLLEYENILKASESGFMSAEERKIELDKRRIIECVRLTIKDGYMMPSSLYNYFEIENECAKEIINTCEKMGYLEKSILPGSLSSAISKEDFERIFNEKL